MEYKIKYSKTCEYFFSIIHSIHSLGFINKIKRYTQVNIAERKQKPLRKASLKYRTEVYSGFI